jgi:hypothetical protein
MWPPASLVIASRIQWRKARPALLVSRERVKICLPAGWQSSEQIALGAYSPKHLMFGQRINLRRDTPAAA